MKKVFLNFSLVILALQGELLLSACGENPVDPGSDTRVVYMLPETQPMELTDDQKSMVQKNNDFAFNLFRTINEQDAEKQSNSLSPISVTFMMGMLNDGAAGNTSKEITSMLGFGERDAKSINEFCKTMIEGLPNTDTSIKLDISNYIATNSYKNVVLESQFEKNMKDYYHAETASLDFSKSDAVKTINNWCYTKTDGKIWRILDELDSQALLVLLNIVNYKAGWVEKFDKNKTLIEDFTLDNGKKQSLPMMHQKGYIKCYGNDTYTALLLPYGGNEPKWHMAVLLPDEGKTIEDVLANLTAESWNKCLSEMYPLTVDIKIPRFSVESKNDLGPAIAKLGAPSIFNPEVADFSKMSNYSNLYVGVLKQNTAIEVDESGTELVAVTMAGMTGANVLGKQDLDFHCNRPFVYVIYEASSGTVFFIGTYRG